jgi:hypothetical protein
MQWNNPTKVLGKSTPEYNMWIGFMNRCYNKGQRKLNPSYENCLASSRFQNFDHFVEWLYLQVGFNREGWQLDKDILYKGNKVYSEDTCCLVPKEINVVFTHKRRDKGLHPIGVSYKSRLKKYVAQISLDKVVTHLGCFETSENAFAAYKTAKEAYVKTLANKWKGQIDERVYEALMKWEINIDD